MVMKRDRFYRASTWLSQWRSRPLFVAFLNTHVFSWLLLFNKRYQKIKLIYFIHVYYFNYIAMKQVNCIVIHGQFKLLKWKCLVVNRYLDSVSNTARWVTVLKALSGYALKDSMVFNCFKSLSRIMANWSIAGVTPIKIDQNKIKLIEICMETPCWCLPGWAPTGRTETNRNICYRVWLQKREFILRETHKH